MEDTKTEEYVIIRGSPQSCICSAGLAIARSYITTEYSSPHSFDTTCNRLIVSATTSDRVDGKRRFSM